ncbi:MAG: histidinol-phosphatase, partial [Acidimicrobiales bacterium]
CDVLAHPDVIKVAGHRPGVPGEFHDRIAEAAAQSGMAAEVSSAGWRKPAGESYPAPGLLDAFRARSVPITTASDSHGPEHVAYRCADLRAMVTAAGYTSLRTFEARTAHDVDLATAGSAS